MLAPILALGCALISISVVPFGAPGMGPHGFDLFEISNINVGLLVILGITSMSVYGIALAGWSSNNKYSLLGALRSSAQMISYELGPRSVARRRSPARRLAQSPRHRRAAGHGSASRPGTSLAGSSSSPSSST
jgi:hypothetical protein